MDIVRNNLSFFANLTNDSDILNITIKDNKITQNDNSWLRNNSVDGDQLHNVIVWTFDNAIINFWEHYTIDEWLSEVYIKKYNETYDAFVSLNYIYEKCKEHDYPKEIQDKMKDYDKELDIRLDIIYENCIETCKPWNTFKDYLRKFIKTNDEDEYECLVPNSDAVSPLPPSPPSSPLLSSNQLKKD